MIVLLVVSVVRRDVGFFAIFIWPIVWLTFMFYHLSLDRRSYKAWLSTFEDGWTPKEHARGEGSRRIRL